MLQLLHLYMTAGKVIALTIWTLSAKWCLCFLIHCLGDGGAWWAAIYGVAQSRIQLKWLSSSRFIITFLLRSRHLLISWLQSPSADFGAPKNKVCHCFHCFPIYFPWSDGTRSSSWNQDWQEKYQQPQIHTYTTLMAESEEEIKRLLMKVREEIEKDGSKQHSEN